MVLLERLGDAGAREAFASFDQIYHQGTGASPLVEVVERLARAKPIDAPEIELASYRQLVEPWQDWTHLASRGRHFGEVLAALALGGEG